MIYGSVCSGIEAASVAWEVLDWTPAWFAEIEPFPCSVLAHHWPAVQNLGDMTTIADKVIAGNVPAPDVLVGGTPCQAFSVAGLRKGLDDERGALSIAFVRLADAIDHVRGRSGQQPSIVVWENVPGVLSSKDNAFGCFLGALAGEDEELQPAGGRWTDAGCVFGPTRAVAWRVLDAQYFGVAQRRRRVFVVASARAGFHPAQVLFEFDGVRRDSAPSRGEAKSVAALTANGVGTCGADDNQGQAGHLIAATLDASYARLQGCSGQDANHGHSHLIPQCITGDITHTLKAEGFDASEDGTWRGQPIIAFSAKDYGGDAQENLSPTLRAGGHSTSHANAGVMPAVAYSVALRGREGGATAELGDDAAGCLRAASGGGDKPHVLTTFMADDYREGTYEPCDTARPLTTSADRSRAAPIATDHLAVRRLTPVECERLQGFPDGHTDVPHRGKPAADGPRYKALGNSMAVPVMRWIGSRIKRYAK